MGLVENVVNIHALHVLEFAAAIAFVVKPQMAAKYLKELGLNIDATVENPITMANGASDLSNPAVRVAFKQAIK